MWWEVLGVSPDADTAEIKRAYSALIKHHRPDDDPEAFSRIRAAFEAGRRVAKKNRNQEPSKPGVQELSSPPEPSLNPRQEPARYDQPFKPIYQQDFSYSPPEELTPEEPQPVRPDYRSLNTEVIAALDSWKASRYKDDKSLQAVLQHSELNHFDGFERLSQSVFEWLMTNIAPKSGFLATTTNIPVKTIQEMDRLFGWSKREREFYVRYRQDLSLIFYAINSDKKEGRYVDPVLHEKIHKTTSTQPSNRGFSRILWGVFIGIFWVAMLTNLSQAESLGEYLFYGTLLAVFVARGAIFSTLFSWVVPKKHRSVYRSWFWLKWSLTGFYIFVLALVLSSLILSPTVMSVLALVDALKVKVWLDVGIMLLISAVLLYLYYFLMKWWFGRARLHHLKFKKEYQEML